MQGNAGLVERQAESFQRSAIPLQILGAAIKEALSREFGRPLQRHLILTVALPASSARIEKVMNYHEHIQRDPNLVGGEPVLKGTRVTLRTVLASLAEGATTSEILADFPTLCEEDVRAAIAFAATSAQEDLPVAESPV
jgi:uncharacterized protein (DUF433 family)